MPCYERATEDLVEQLRVVMEQFHPHLIDAEVRVDLLLAYRGEADDYALKAHGYGALATVKITNLLDRVKGMGDIEILIDGDHCDEWSQRELHALFDHELTHIELVADRKTGGLKRDDHGRPKCKMRLHDRQMGWFDVVAQRWGNDSAEVQQCTELMRDWEFVQVYLPGFDPAMLGCDRDKKEFQDAGAGA